MGEGDGRDFISFTAPHRTGLESAGKTKVTGLFPPLPHPALERGCAGRIIYKIDSSGLFWNAFYPRGLILEV